MRTHFLIVPIILLGMNHQVSVDKISSRDPLSADDRETARGRGRNNNNNKKDDYKAGDGESVKKWKSESVDDAKKEDKPICLYIYDSSNKKNARAKLLEGPAFLDDSTVKDKLKGFTCIKLSVTDDSKGWPAPWVESARNGATLILVSGDLKNNQIFDSTTPKESIVATNLIASLDAVLKYEDQRKATESKKTTTNAPTANDNKNADKVAGKK